MEEILASIRRIISDEVAAEATAAPEVAPPPARPVMSEPGPRAPLSATRASEPVSSPYAPKRPLLPPYDPFAPRPRTLSAAASAPVDSLRTVSQARPLTPSPVVAPEPVAVEPPAPVVDDEPDMDAPFAAALMDLAMVEQAVQAELASVMADATSMSEPETAGFSLEDIATRDEPVIEQPVEAFAAPLSEPVAYTRSEAFTAPETTDMQVQAKPAPTLPRATPAAPAPTDRFTAPAATAPVEPPRGLVSAPTNNAVAASFGSLARTVASNSRTVEDLVTDAVRPMLKSWLDENLPALVERLVRAEIERVARHGS